MGNRLELAQRDERRPWYAAKASPESSPRKTTVTTTVAEDLGLRRFIAAFFLFATPSRHGGKKAAMNRRTP
jgi:hypothetical protein